MRYFAIGLKGWTQIKMARVQPKALTLTATYNAEKARENLYFDEVLQTFRWGPKAVKLRMKSTTYEGGKTIGTIKSRAFSKIVGASVSNGGIIELLPEQAKTVIEYLKGREL